MKTYLKSFLTFLCMSVIILLDAEPVPPTVKGEEVTYTDGNVTLKGYVAYNLKQQGKRPAIVVVPEWWGNND
ncbi:MAG: dienelactone hydrolase family protein, partial [Aquabacterium sp.]|nr:dienelactone hydrolase family protein [Ferruginibacter sp.]